jgi:hypothetical protein
MFGCSSSGSGTPALTPAKNVYLIQNTNTSDVENDSILVLPATSTGAVTPGSTLMLPTNFVAFAVATGPTGEIYVGGATSDTIGEVLVYAAGATGAATPTATLTGGGMGTFTVPLFLAVNSKGQLYVFSNDGSIESFAAGATSAANPAQYLTYDVTLQDYPGGIGADDAGEIVLVDEKANTIDVFAAGATGSATPVRTITAMTAAEFSDVYGLAVDGEGDITVANYNEADDPYATNDGGGRPVKSARFEAAVARFKRRAVDARPDSAPTLAPTAIISFAAGATGVATPVKMISGATTTVNEPEGLAIDALKNVYYEDYEGGAPTVMVFPLSAAGNVAPSSAMTSTEFTASYFGSLAAY